MGYEIAGGLGVKLAQPGREVIVMVGDGSYLMLNSEIATSVLLGRRMIVVVQDNHGYGCINRLQQETGASRSTTLQGLRPGPFRSAGDRLREARANRWERSART